MVLACALFGVAPLLAQTEQSVKLPVKPGAPQGFEALDGPRETAIDLSYGGLRLGSFRAVYTPKNIAFAAPDDIVSKIPSLKHDMQYRVLSALTGELPANADKICGHIEVKGCGTLQPEVAGVIFYEDSFHAELFIASAMLEDQDTHKDKILPPAPDVFSSIHTINGNFNSTTSSFAAIGTPSQQQNWSLQDNSTYAYGSGRVNISGSASDTQSQISTITGSLDRWGLDNKIGFFDSHPMQMLPQVHMSGVSVGTSLNTNLALRDAAGNRLAVFLPQRAWVSLIYNNVIYSTDFYEAGNQILNTDALPEGAYEVVLRIRDTGGGQTEEKRFFAKNFEIPPADQPIYFGQLGMLRGTEAQTSFLPTIGDKGLIAGGGTVQRLTDSTGVDTDLLLIKNRLYGEAGAFLLLPPDHQLRASMLLSSGQDYGFNLSYLAYGFDKRLAISSDIRAIFAGKAPLSTDPSDLQPLVSGTAQQISTNASYQLDNKTNIGLQGSYTKSGGKQQYAFGPSLRYDFWRDSNSILTLSANSADTSDGMQHAILLRFSMQMGKWGYSADGGVRAGSPAALGGVSLSKNADGRVTWNDDKDPGRLTLIGVEARHDDLTDSFIGDYEHRGQYGNIKLIGSQNMSAQGTNRFYSGTFGVGIAQSGGDISVGGNQLQNSGFIVKTTGNSADTPMKVVINNSEHAEFKTGDSVAVFVPPYQTYTITVKPTQSASIDYDGTAKRITLYPGNILPMVWDINRVNVVLGHVVLEDGTPLANARLEESRNLSVTDDEGMFQGELLELKNLTFKRAAEQPPLMDSVKAPEDFDIFSLLPDFHPHRHRTATMTTEAQNQAVMELYGEGEKETPQLEEKLITESVEPAQTPIPPPPPKKLLPALRCRVALPETHETNGVYIYSDPLTCTPIAFDEDPKTEPPEPRKEAFDPVVTPKLELADGLIRGKPLQTPAPVIEAPPAAIEKHYATPLPEPSPLQLLADLIDPVPLVTLAALPSLEYNPAHGESVIVQLGAFRTEEKALAVRDTLLRKFTALADKTPYVLKADLGSKGVYYRLRAGDFDTVGQAQAFCHELAAQGQDCQVPVWEEIKTASASWQSHSREGGNPIQGASAPENMLILAAARWIGFPPARE